jgi:hypothetical protein
VTGRWGWRPLVMSLFISVFVVACNIVNSPTPTPTASAIPPVTLTPTAAVTAAPRQTEPAPVVSLQSSLAFATPPPVVVEPPRCYPNGGDMTLCLGLARNTSTQAVERVVVQVSLASDTLISAIEQAVIPPDGYAPYRAVFSRAWQPDPAAYATLIQAAPFNDESYITLEIESERRERIERQYRLSATLYNASPYTATNIRAVLTFISGDGGVVGYRVARIPQRLAAGARLPIAIDLAPQEDSDTLSHLLYIEAQRENE